jgi:actin-related protein 8
MDYLQYALFLAGGEELKRRLYSCIVVVGGGFKFEGLGPWLQNKISLNIPRAFKSGD